MDLSLVGSQMSSDALSEESSVCEGVGYNETFGSGDESEGFSPSSDRETSTQSLDDEDEGYAEGSEGVGVDEVGKEGSGSDSGDDDDREESDGYNDDDGEDGDGDGESYEGASVGPRDNRPFILPAEWAVNKFLPSMSDKVFKELRVRYRSQSISQSVSLRRTKNVTQGGRLTLVCMTLCLLPDSGFC